MLNGLDLFSGIGGISLALNEWVRPIAYCEIDTYCQGVLLSRMASGDLSYAPIWNDIKTLRIRPQEVDIDIIYGGFPCQDISTLGNGKGLEGERSGLFFEIIRLLRESRPGFCFLENVPSITTRGGIRIIREITNLGYDCRWCVLSNSSSEIPHKRNRWFLLAHSHSKSGRKADTFAEPLEIEGETWVRSSRQNRGDISRTYRKENKCPILGVDDGLPFELDRARGLGNSVVPQQAKQAFKILMGIKN